MIVADLKTFHDHMIEKITELNKILDLSRTAAPMVYFPGFDEPNPEWYSLKDAAEYHGVSKSTILRWAKAGKLESDKSLSKNTCYSNFYHNPKKTKKITRK